MGTGKYITGGKKKTHNGKTRKRPKQKKGKKRTGKPQRQNTNSKKTGRRRRTYTNGKKSSSGKPIFFPKLKLKLKGGYSNVINKPYPLNEYNPVMTPGYLYSKNSIETRATNPNNPTVKQQGGSGLTGYVPGDLVDLYRSSIAGLTSGIDTFNGQPSNVSTVYPLSYQQPYLEQNVNFNNNPMDVNGILTDAYNTASSY